MSNAIRVSGSRGELAHLRLNGTRIILRMQRREVMRSITERVAYACIAEYLEYPVPSKPNTETLSFNLFFGQAFDRLVTFSSMHYCTYTYDLSTLSSSRGLIIEGYLILRGASRLDAFSVYPFRTWLLCDRIGS